MPALVHCTLRLKEYLEISGTQSIMYAYDVWCIYVIYTSHIYGIYHIYDVIYMTYGIYIYSIVLINHRGLWGLLVL